MPENRIEDIMKDVLSGAALINALAFAEYLQASDLSVSEVNANADIQVTYKNEPMCHVHIKDEKGSQEPWIIWIQGDYSGESAKTPIDERMKEVAWANVNPCGNEACGHCSDFEMRRIVFGKEFDNACRYSTFEFVAPNAETLECVKNRWRLGKGKCRRSNSSGYSQ